MYAQGPTPENGEWRATLEELGISYRQRRLSGALVALCIFHDERTASMYMWPSGNLYCHGCGAEERIEGFTEKAKIWRTEADGWAAEFDRREGEIVTNYGPKALTPPF